MNSKQFGPLTPLAAFNDPKAVVNYSEGPPRMVPGFADMQRMTTLLLAEFVPENGHVLVLGAGGGLELKVFADSHPNWKFDGIDPSDAMLSLAEKYLGDLNSRIQLKKGYINDAPNGPYDGATCILTMHFMTLEERKKALIAIRNRLKPGAPFVMVHMSIPKSDLERTVWFSRYAAFGISSGMPAEQMAGAREALETKLNIFSPKQEERMLDAAGFTNISQFYTGFTFRGWVSYA